MTLLYVTAHITQGGDLKSYSKQCILSVEYEGRRGEGRDGGGSPLPIDRAVLTIHLFYKSYDKPGSRRPPRRPRDIVLYDCSCCLTN